MVYRVSIFRTSSAEAVLHVDADDERQARELAEQRARDGMCHWVECGDQVDSMAEVVEKVA